MAGHHFTEVLASGVFLVCIYHLKYLSQTSHLHLCSSKWVMLGQMLFSTKDLVTFGTNQLLFFLNSFVFMFSHMAF